MLERGEIDLLLHNHMRQIPGISAEFLMKDRLLFITPKNHLLNAYGIKSAKPYPWIDLSWFKNENFMLLPEAYTLREHAEQLFASLGWRPETIEIYTRTETILRLVTAGAGVGFIFESYLSYFNEERKPACFLIGILRLRWIIWLFIRKNETISGFHPFFGHDPLCIIKVMLV